MFEAQKGHWASARSRQARGAVTIDVEGIRIKAWEACVWGSTTSGIWERWILTLASSNAAALFLSQRRSLHESHQWETAHRCTDKLENHKEQTERTKYQD